MGQSLSLHQSLRLLVSVLSSCIYWLCLLLAQQAKGCLQPRQSIITSQACLPFKAFSNLVLLANFNILMKELQPLYRPHQESSLLIAHYSH